ncbi:MAG TPA: hypothetical protein VF466_04730 [Candidatus Saccharimonadales bacterium]
MNGIKRFEWAPTGDFPGIPKAPYEMGAAELGEKPIITGWPQPTGAPRADAPRYSFAQGERLSQAALDERAAAAAALAELRATVRATLGLDDPLPSIDPLASDAEVGRFFAEEIEAARFRIGVERAGGTDIGQLLTETHAMQVHEAAGADLVVTTEGPSAVVYELHRPEDAAAGAAQNAA